MKIYRGIDVAKWQGYIDFEKVQKAGIDFVMIKATQGRMSNYPFPFKDGYFDMNMLKCSEIKGAFYVGVYHLLDAQTISAAKNEAEFFIKAITPYKEHIQLWAVVDVEIPEDRITANRAEYSEIVKTFTDAIKAAGFRPMIYTAQWYINGYFDAPADVPLWLVDVNTNKFPEGARMWQAGMGYIDGINGKVDIDYAKNIMGDVNNDGKVNMRDVLDTMKHIITGKEINTLQADIDRDGEITARDVTAIMRIISA